MVEASLYSEAETMEDSSDEFSAENLEIFPPLT